MTIPFSTLLIILIVAYLLGLLTTPLLIFWFISRPVRMDVEPQHSAISQQP